MLRRLYASVVLMLTGLALTAFTLPLSEAEDTGNPWWMWLLIVVVLIAFAAFAIWWWRGSHSEEEQEGTAAVSPPQSQAGEAPVATDPPAEEVAVQLTLPAEEEEKEVPTEPDDLTRVEGIGPKISSVLQAAGINTYAALASTDAAQIRQILGDESPNLLRLADPSTWPQQAELAAAGDWDGLAKLQGQLKGGRKASAT